MFACADLKRIYHELTDHGVRFAVAPSMMPPSMMPFGWWSTFEDNDGTRYALGRKIESHHVVRGLGS
jgi:lactoylglutathione lyase